MAPGIDLEPNSALRSRNGSLDIDSTLTHPPSTLVIKATLITTDHDALKFEAAAALQVLPSTVTPWTKNIPSLSTQLISSPYNDPSHYLDLSTLETPSLFFAKALTLLRPIRSDYATAPYVESMNWETVLDFLQTSLKQQGAQWPEQSFYVVIFRSKLNPTIDVELLKQLDYESHREACESGGLLKYWFGSPNSERRNLATCLWRSKEDARKGGLGPWHKRARAAARDLYADITFSMHRFTIEEGAKGWRFEEWVDGK